MSKLTLKANTKKIGKYGLNRGEAGIYDVRNPLNDLTGRQWTHFTNSVYETDFSLSSEDMRLLEYLKDSLFGTRYSTNGKESYAHKIRKQHPSPKPPQLMKSIIEFFTKKGQTILDPFMGVGGTLLGASLSDRNAIGIDLSEEYISVYKKANKELSLREQKAIAADSTQLDKINLLKKYAFDAIITDPPYGNMLSKKRTGGDKTKEIGVSTPFTDSSNDLGNLDYKNFILALTEIISKASQYLKPKGYIIIFTKDMQPTREHHNMLHADIASSIMKIDKMAFKGYRIWYDKTLNLYPYGYPFSFVANQLHQFILVFRKEKN